MGILKLSDCCNMSVTMVGNTPEQEAQTGETFHYECNGCANPCTYHEKGI